MSFPSKPMSGQALSANALSQSSRPTQPPSFLRLNTNQLANKYAVMHKPTNDHSALDINILPRDNRATSQITFTDSNDFTNLLNKQSIENKHIDSALRHHTTAIQHIHDTGLQSLQTLGDHLKNHHLGLEHHTNVLQLQHTGLENHQRHIQQQHTALSNHADVLRQQNTSLQNHEQLLDKQHTGLLNHKQILEQVKATNEQYAQRLQDQHLGLENHTAALQHLLQEQRLHKDDITAYDNALRHHTSVLNEHKTGLENHKSHIELQREGLLNHKDVLQDMHLGLEHHTKVLSSNQNTLQEITNHMNTQTENLNVLAHRTSAATAIAQSTQQNFDLLRTNAQLSMKNIQELRVNQQQHEHLLKEMQQELKKLASSAESNPDLHARCTNLEKSLQNVNLSMNQHSATIAANGEILKKVLDHLNPVTSESNAVQMQNMSYMAPRGLR